MLLKERDCYQSRNTAVQNRVDFIYVLVSYGFGLFFFVFSRMRKCLICPFRTSYDIAQGLLSNDIVCYKTVYTLLEIDCFNARSIKSNVTLVRSSLYVSCVMNECLSILKYDFVIPLQRTLSVLICLSITICVHAISETINIIILNMSY